MLAQSLMKKITPKKLFLIDSSGALLTTLLLFFVLANLESVFGMPKQVLYYLSAIAFSFCIYSFLCYLRVGQNWKPFLTGIAVANLMYCCLTIGLVIFYRAELTILGWAYFLGEAAIILVLVYFEYKFISGSGDTKVVPTN